MAILSKKKSNKKKLAGAHIPLHIFDYLNIHSIINQVSKSEIIRQQIESWYDGENSLNSYSKLEKTLTKKIQKEWELEKKLHKEIDVIDNFRKFTKNIHQELKEKNVENIDEILDNLTI